MSQLKRKQPEPRTSASILNASERAILNVIESTTDMGIVLKDLKQALMPKIADITVTKSLKSLEAKNLIKSVSGVQPNRKKIYMGVEYKPSDEITGGSWYVDGNIDQEFIDVLKQGCLKAIGTLKVLTMEQTTVQVNKLGFLKEPASQSSVAEILKLLELEKSVEVVKSTGGREFKDIPAGAKCYRIPKKAVFSKPGAFASIPCRVCPRISECTPDGIISPKTCIYFEKWLDF